MCATEPRRGGGRGAELRFSWGMIDSFRGVKDTFTPRKVFGPVLRELRNPSQPAKNKSRREWNVEDALEDGINKHPCPSGQEKRERPFFTVSCLKMEKGAEQHAEGKAEQPDCREETDDPPPNAGGATVDNVGRQARFFYFLSLRNGRAAFTGKFEDELDERKGEHGKPDGPGEETGPEIELPALPKRCGKHQRDGKTEDYLSPETKPDFSSRRGLIRC